MKGYNEKTNLYTSRYYAMKAARGDEIAVKVFGGYTIMKIADWMVWKKQR